MTFSQHQFRARNGVVAGALLIAVSFPAHAQEPASKSICELPEYRGTADYARYCSSSNNGSQVDAETRAEWRRMAQEQREREYDDETWSINKEGVDCYNRNDYTCAADRFRRAMHRLPKGTQGYDRVAGHYALALSAADNQAGVDCYNRGDYRCAVPNFERALSRLKPDGDDAADYAIVADSLAKARAALADQPRREKEQEQARLNVAADQRVAQHLAQLAAQAQSGDFDGHRAGADATAGLDFVDPSRPPPAPAIPQPSTPSPAMPVQAKVDMNAPAWSDSLLALAPEMLHSPGLDAYRKGLGLLQSTHYPHDWPAVRAWWQVALQKDPQNRFLQRGVEFALYMEARGRAPASSGTLVLPEPGDIELLGILDQRPVTSFRFDEITPEEWERLDHVAEQALFDRVMKEFDDAMSQKQLIEAAKELASPSAHADSGVPHN
ncbi:MAG: hypothetical protein JSR34_01940 [Proteobacteria bacterium]|nr:hypothetical protein [Pseudomonadota bacterium]